MNFKKTDRDRLKFFSDRVHSLIYLRQVILPSKDIISRTLEQRTNKRRAPGTNDNRHQQKISALNGQEAKNTEQNKNIEIKAYRIK